MKCLIITGGEAPDPSQIKSLLSKEWYIIAADSGLDYCMDNSLTPDIVLGDFDSLSDKSVLERFSKDSVFPFPEDKDYTDTEIAIKKAVDMGFDSLTLIGGGEGRADHFLALVDIFSRTDVLTLWITARERIFKINKQYNGKGVENGLISFFPLSNVTIVKKSRGLKWPLDNVNWKNIPFSLSNRISEDSFFIEMERGELLALQSLPY